MSQSIEIIVEGMDCNNCALGLRKNLQKEGFQNADVIFASKTVNIDIDNKEDIDRAKQKIEQLGYKVSNVIGYEYNNAKNTSFTISLTLKLIISIAFTLPLILSMFPWFGFLHNPQIQLILSTPVYILGVFHFGKSAYYSIKSRVPNMDVLIILGATASYIYSLIGFLMNLGHDYMFFETSASIITIILVGNYLEKTAIKKTTSAIDELSKLQEIKAKRIINNQAGEQKIEFINAKDIKIDDLIIVNHGDQIPIDGIIVSGTATVNVSMITGEAFPQYKETSENVVGGTIIEQGNLTIKANATIKNSVLTQIINLVKKAQSDKPKLQSLADKISAWFIPVIVSLAFITFFINFFGINQTLTESILRSIAVLVIACPCALGLAIPTAVVVGIGRVSKRGILIKGGRTLEKIAEVKTIAFDKTGTITNGNFEISKITTYRNHIEDDIKAIVKGLEKYSSHPIANALYKSIGDIPEKKMFYVEEIKGIGMKAKDEFNNVLILGSQRILEFQKIFPTHDLYLTENNEIIAGIDIQDKVKPEAFQSISELKKLNIKTLLISGDKESKCNDIKTKTGIDEIYSEQLPSQKLEIIERIQKNESIAMVGDGINDAPALSKANVGISMGDATKIAIQSSDIILLQSNLKLIPQTIKIARITTQIIKQNLFWAFFYNVLAIPLAMFGYLNPMVAAICMALSDVIVIVNSLRIRMKKI